MKKISALILVISALVIVMLGCGTQKMEDAPKDKKMSTEELLEGIWEIDTGVKILRLVFSDNRVLPISVYQSETQYEDICKWTLENGIMMLKEYWSDENIVEFEIKKIDEKILQLGLDGQTMQLERKSSTVDTNLMDGIWRADDIIRGLGTERFQGLNGGLSIASNLFLDNLKFYNDGTYSGGFYFEYGGELHKSKDLNGTYRIAHDGKALCFNGTTYYEYVCIENRLEMKDASGEVATFTLEQ